LPLVELPAEKPAPPGQEAPPTRSLRVLLVEDNQDAAESLQMLLELYGHEAALVHTGPAGVEKARAWRPDVVLCDIGLPGMDGFTVARTLRADPSTAKTYLIALSGYGSEADQRRCREAGFDLHLAKPVEPGELREVLANLPVDRES
jgi:CheY-like chemotaxis protein